MADIEHTDFGFFLFKCHFDHSWSKNIQIINPQQTDVKDWSSKIMANNATLAYNFANIKPYPHLSGHLTFQRASLTVSYLRLSV